MSRADLRRVAPLLMAARYEVLPASGVVAAIEDIVPKSVAITVTASPARGLESTLEVAGQLRAAGYEVVPHLSARLIRDDTHLAELVDNLVAAGVTDVFVPAGDADPPAGKFHSSLEVLERLTAMGSPFARVGITGYPERHPKIDDDVTIQAMWDKRRHATYIVSNLCFDPKVLRAWVARIRRRGITLPLLIGLAGPVDRSKLIAMATKIGAAESARFLAAHASWFVRLGTPGAYQPERLLARTATALTAPGANVTGLHVFTFGQVRQTEQWRRALISRLETGTSDTAQGL